MGRRICSAAVCLATWGLLAWGVLLRAETLQSSPDEQFELEIRPVLAQTCFPCHGGKKTSAGLRVDSRAALLRGGDAGPAVVPGDLERSLVIKAIGHSDPDLKMPPSKRLPEATVRAFTAWVSAGARWPEGSRTRPAGAEFLAQRHWAFEPVRSVESPPDPSDWSENSVDRFIAAKHRAAGLHPNPDTDL
ncbi:MAG: c-type cytochrome domain-containing protein [Isosphaeraceae bacterium]